MKPSPCFFLTLVLACLVLPIPALQANESVPVPLELEQILPAETLVYAKCTGVEQFLAESQALDLMQLWAEPEVQEFFADLKTMIPRKEKGQVETRAPIKELWSILQGDIALAMTGRLTILHEGACPSMVLSLDMGLHKEAFLKTMHGLIKKLVAMRKVDTGVMDYRGYEIGYMSLPGPGIMICHAAVDNLFLFTINPYFMRDLIDCRLDERQVLARDPAFMRCKNKVGGDDVDLMLFANLQPLLKMIEPLCPYEVKNWLNMLGLQQIDALCLASTLEAGGSRDSFFIDCPGEKTGLLKALAPHPITWENLRYASPDALYFLNFTLDPEQIMTEVDRFVQAAFPMHYHEFREGIAEFKEETGFDLESEILGPLGSEFCFFAAMPQTGGMMVIPDMILYLFLDDVEGFIALQNKVMAILGQEAQVSQSTYKGRTLQHISPPRGSEVPITPTFTIEGNRLIFASSPMTLKKHLQWIDSGEPGLEKVSELNLAGVPRDTTCLEVINLKRCVEMGYNLGAPFLPMALAEIKAPLDATLLPMANTVSKHISGGVAYSMANQEGMLSTGSCTFGLGALFAVAVQVADYLVKEELVEPLIFGMNRVGQSRPSEPVEISDLKSCQQLMFNGKYAEAESAFTVWIETHPGHPSQARAHVDRGYCRLVLKKRAEAVADYEFVINYPAAQDLHALAYYNLACAASLQSENDKALGYLEKAVDSGWKDIKTMATDRDFDNIRHELRFKALIGEAH